MSTPQTLSQTLPHQHLDHRQRLLPSPQDRYLPPPRPSSDLSNSYHPNIPTRPSSNLSNRQFPPPLLPESGMSNHAYTTVHSQARTAAEYSQSHELPYQPPNDSLTRPDSRISQHHRQLPPLPLPQTFSKPPAPASAAAATIPADSPAENSAAMSPERGRKRRQKSAVDWVAFFGGKPPAEIIEIHDDDSPPPPTTSHRLPPETTDSRTLHHVDKKRRVVGGSGDVPTYSTTHTPYSYSNGTSTESLQTTTAATSLGSQASTSSRLDTAQVGQKRKRTTRTSDADRKKQETERLGPKGYLAEYGDYVPPPKQHKKQKDVVVPAIYDVCLPPLPLILFSIESYTNF